MYLRLVLILISFITAAAADAPAGNQADQSRVEVLEAWKYLAAENHGVHAWNSENDASRVFQEWISIMTATKSGTPEERKRVGLALEKYVVGGNIGPLAFIGTTVPVPGYDQGDFDMTLLGYSSLLGLFLDDRLLLTDATLVHLIDKVARLWGQTPKAYFDVLFVSVPETENHLFMTESTRYLTNQILWENTRQLPQLAALRDSLIRSGVVIDNKQGILKRLLLKTMHQTMCKGFFEFNAQIYQRFTIHALDNLYSFAHDARIQDGAACLLDYLSTVFAFQSYGSIRYGPYRRSSEVYQDSSLIGRDAACSFFAVQSGAIPWPKEARKGIWRTRLSHSDMALFSTVLKYRIPDPILAYMQNRPAEYRAEIRSAYAGSGSRQRPTEVYYGSGNYLVTAGGRYEPYAGPNFPTYRYWFSDAPWIYDVITRSSSVLLDPSRERPQSRLDILHFKGTQWRANNLAVHRGFLYGYTGVDAYNSQEWPQNVPAKWLRPGENPITDSTYTTRDFDFRFLDRSGSGVYIILGRLRPSATFLRWSYQKYLRGTIEIVDTSKVHSLSELRDTILARNSPTRHWPLGRRRYVYLDFEGNQIRLNSRYDGETDGIIRIDPPASDPSPKPPDLALPFPFPWMGGRPASESPYSLAGFLLGKPEAPIPLFQVELFSPWKGKAALSDGQGNMYVFHPGTGGYVLSNFREWWNPRRMVGTSADAGSQGPK